MKLCYQVDHLYLSEIKKGCNTNPSGTPEMISVDSEVWPFKGTLM